MSIYSRIILGKMPVSMQKKLGYEIRNINKFQIYF